MDIGAEIDDWLKRARSSEFYIGAACPTCYRVMRQPSTDAAQADRNCQCAATVTVKEIADAFGLVAPEETRQEPMYITVE